MSKKRALCSKLRRIRTHQKIVEKSIKLINVVLIVSTQIFKSKNAVHHLFTLVTLYVNTIIITFRTMIDNEMIYNFFFQFKIKKHNIVEVDTQSQNFRCLCQSGSGIVLLGLGRGYRGRRSQKGEASHEEASEPRDKNPVDFSKVECHRCHKNGHYARNCAEPEPIRGSSGKAQS